MSGAGTLFDLLGVAEALPPPPANDQRPLVQIRATPKAKVYRDAQVSLLRAGTDGLGGALAVERDEFTGWQEELGAPRPIRWPACRPPDGQPCHRVGCRLNMRLDFPSPVGVQLDGAEPWLAINSQSDRAEVGRRPALTPAEVGAVVDEFIDEAADLDGMRATCSLVEIEKRGAMSELVVAELLGVDPETIRRETVSALEKLRALAGGEGSGLPEDGLHAMLAALR